MQLDILIISPRKIIFEGKAKSVILPGGKGVFEVLPFHKPLLSTLREGAIFVDDNIFLIKDGVVKVGYNQVIAVVE